MMKSLTGLATLVELSQKTGLSVSALNYYTNLGLLQVADRKGNRRLYREADSVRQIERIRQMRQQGYPLRIIRNQVRQRAGA